MTGGLEVGRHTEKCVWPAGGKRICSLLRVARNRFIRRILSAAKNGQILRQAHSSSKTVRKALQLRRSTVLYDAQRDLDLKIKAICEEVLKREGYETVCKKGTPVGGVRIGGGW